MKKIIYTTAICAALFTTSCSFLDDNPQGIMSEKEAISKADGLATAAYAALGNDHYDTPFSLWIYGNVRADDAYKGGQDVSDIQVFHFYEIAQNIDPTYAEADKFWFMCYQAVSRTNTALKALQQASDAEVPNRQSRIGEMYFLRGHFYFILKTCLVTFRL